MNTNGYTEIKSIENSRNCLRRIIHDDQELSNQSIINVIEKFVKTVNAMDETILVPSRLMDSQVGDSTDSVIPAPVKFSYNKKKATIRDSLATTDLFNLYQLLNNVKVDLLWGRNGVVEQKEMTEDDLREQHYDTIEPSVVPTVVVVPEIKTEETTVVTLARTPSVTESTTTTSTTASSTKGHIRRPSTASVSSSNSASTISDSESEISSNENDSGIESENQQEKDKSLEMSRQFRCHLLGLYKSLEQMTEAANYLTTRYQCDIGGA